MHVTILHILDCSSLCIPPLNVGKAVRLQPDGIHVGYATAKLAQESDPELWWHGAAICVHCALAIKPGAHLRLIQGGRR